MHIRSYLREAAFIASASADVTSAARIAAASARFHLNNLRKRSGVDGAAQFTANVKIGDKVRAISLRQYSGDLFIFYEVLAFESYKIDADALEPSAVRTIVDCGGNIGMTALYMANRYPNARIYSIEPDPRNFAVLRHNVSAEPRIVPINAAVVGRNEGPVHLSQDQPAWGNVITQSPGSTATVQVEAITLTELCEAHAIERIDLLKVDIEGAEESVFAEPSFLSRVGFIVIELHGEYSFARFSADVAPHGFVVDPPAAAGGVRAYVAYRK